MSAANPVTLPLSGYAARHVRLAVDGKVATLTLNRPDKKNPLTFESYAEIADLFRAAAKDKAVKAFVITGAGGNFCSGGDVFEIIGPLVEMDDRGAARLHPHDRRGGEGDARLPAADRRRDRRRVRRRRRHPRHGLRHAARNRRRPRSRSCSTASGSPAATWAPARSCRASSARAAPRSCSTPAACMGGEEAERWGFFNRLVAPDSGAGARRSSWRASSPTGPTFANAMTKRMLEMEWAMSVEQRDRGRGGRAGAVHGDRGFRARLPRLRREAEAGVRGQLRWTLDETLSWPFFDDGHRRFARGAGALGRRDPARAAARRRRRGLPRARRGARRGRLPQGRACRPSTAGCIRSSTCARSASRARSWRSATGSPISPSPCRGSAPARSRCSARAELKQRYLPPVRDGKAIAAFALSEPEAGSDVAALATTATPDGQRRMCASTARRPGSRTAASPTTTSCSPAPAKAPGAKGLSAFVVDADTPGLQVDRAHRGDRAASARDAAVRRRAACR